MSRVLVTSRMFGKLDRAPLDFLLARGCETAENPHAGSTLNEAQLLELIREVDAVIAGDDDFSADVLARADRLKVIAKYGVGVDRIDLEAATERGVVVANAPGANKHAVADLVFGFMISLARQIPRAQKIVESGGWTSVTGREIHGKTLGIVGLGQIGREVAKRAGGFSMEILAHDPYADEDFARSQRITLGSLDDVLSASDFATLHVPSLPSTRKLIGAEKLALMKPGACLINAARGDVVDEDALRETLDSGHLAGAALDALAEEPPPEGHPLVGREDVIVTPHMAGHSMEAHRALGDVCARSVVSVLEGERPPHPVNPEVYGD